MAETIQLTVNGRRHDVTVDAETPLLYVLRNDLRLNGPQFGCGLAQCGACTVHLNGAAPRARATPVVGARPAPRSSRSKALARPRSRIRSSRPSSTSRPAQCGYCINGMIMAGGGLPGDERPRRPRTRSRQALDGNLCRCGTHVRIVRAVRRAAEAMA